MKRPVSPPVFRFVPGSGTTAETEGSDGGAGDSYLVYLATVGYTFFEAVYDNAGVPTRCVYLSTFGSDSRWTLAGFIEEPFIVNSGSIPTPWTLASSTAILGPIPFGTAVSFDNLTKDGSTNVSRFLIRLDFPI